MSFSAVQIEGMRAVINGIEQRALARRPVREKPYYPRPSWHQPERALKNLFSKIAVAGPDECHMWTGANVRRYGVVTVALRHMLVTRLLWAITHGSIAEGFDVLHSCDNPPCCNLRHLFLGTHQDNMDDMARKGRRRNGKRAHGEANNRAVLSEREVIEIRNLYADGRPMPIIAERFGITRQNVGFIVRRITWKHIE
jgi:hypothetical protein